MYVKVKFINGGIQFGFFQIFPSFFLNIKNLHLNILEMKKQLNPAPIGIDLGSYKSKIAVAKRGGVEIITNQANFRQTPCVVGFGPSERNIGEAGFIKMKSNFRDTIVAPQKFVGLPANYPNIRSELKHCPCKYDLGSGRIQFSVNYQGQKQTLVAQQALAAYFNKLKSIMEHNELQSKEAVIAIPTYLTQNERKGILNAAKIAQLHVTRLLNESTAVGLEYGIFRKSDLDPKTPRNVLFLDFGHSTFGLYCCSFTKEEMNVLYQDYERNLGCRDLDYIMYEFYKNNFEKTSGGCDISQNRKAVVKLMQNIQRQRKILSGNTQFQMNIEYLMEENDLHYVMKRQEFNQVCKPVFLKMQEVMTNAREKLKEKGIQVHSVELVGGGTRIPQFLRVAKEVFGHEPSRTLNSSQCVARGAALMAAIKSPLFRVAQYTLNQKSHYGIKFSWNFVEGNHFLGTNSEAYPEKQRKMIFEVGSKVPSSKTIKFARKEAIQILIQYEPPVPGFNKHIAYFVTKPQHPKQETFGVQFKLKYTEDGLVVFSDCSLVQQWTQQTKIPKKKQTKPADPAATTGEKKEGEAQPPQPPQPPAEQEFEIKKSKKQKMTEVKYDQNHFEPYNEKDIHDFFTFQSTMRNQDRILIETYEKKNQLESLAYNWKEKLNGSHKQYAKPQSIPEIVAFLGQISQWLYGQGNESNRGTYVSKIQQVHGKILDIQKRYDSFEEVRNELVILVNTLKSCFELCNSLDKQYEHITPEERQVVINQIEGVKHWIHSAEKHQLSKPKWQSPVISGSDVKQRIKQINEKTKKLMSKPVPKKQEPKVENPANPSSTKMDEEKPASDTKMDEEKK